MADKQQTLDVWIVEANTVYRDVPYTVVIDWIQEGRLLEEDQARSPGSKDWKRIADYPGLMVYLPKPEPLRAVDQAEALESIQLDFAWKKPPSDEDDDVDMIPLIDVSLVLLIFFMLTATPGGAAALVSTPMAENASVGDTSGIWISIDFAGEGKTGQSVVYSIGRDGKAASEARDRNIATLPQLLARLDDMLPRKEAGKPIEPANKVRVTINANEMIEDGTVMELTKELSRSGEASQFRREKILSKHTGVREKKS
jgi:biopolymer transport protein ExbD